MPNLDGTWPRGEGSQTWAKKWKCNWQTPAPRNWKWPGGCGQHKGLWNRRNGQDSSTQEASTEKDV